MKKHLTTISVISLMILVAAIIPIAKYAVGEIMSMRDFVKGGHGGKYCYAKQDANKNIRYPVYYKTQEACNASLIQ